MTTALEKYDRLEAAGVWRPGPDAQRQNVIVSIGDATLVITDPQDRALTHWSLPAVERANPGKRPAIYHPDGDPGETLELGVDEAQMIEAIEKLRRAIGRGRPRPGRLRLATLLASLATVAALVVFWLPGALMDHAVSVVPDAKRREIGLDLFVQMQRVSGLPCSDIVANPALRRMAARLEVQQLAVVREGVRDTVALPGGLIVMNRAVVEDFEDPDATAGFLIARIVSAEKTDPMRHLLENAGMTASFRLLTTGGLTPDILRRYAETHAVLPRPEPSTEALLDGFRRHQVRSSPYAYALDPSGETTLELIEADPFTETPVTVLEDRDWVALQGICGS